MKPRKTGSAPRVKRTVDYTAPKKIDNAIKWTPPQRVVHAAVNLDKLISNPSATFTQVDEFTRPPVDKANRKYEISRICVQTISEMTPRAIWAKYRSLLSEYGALLIERKVGNNFKDEERIDEIIDSLDLFYPYAAAVVLHEDNDVIALEKGQYELFEVKELDVPDEVFVISQYLHKGVIRREL